MARYEILNRLRGDKPVNAHRIETVVTQDGTLTLTDLPFQPGEAVEVIILSESSKPSGQNPYALRGKPITYVDPTAPVAENDWDALR